MSVRVAVVGCGFQGRLHVEALESISGVEVVAVCDADPERSRALAADHGIEDHYEDWRKLLADNDCDLLTICTMPNTHREITVAAVESGAHVLCEKPMALGLGEATEMVEAAERAGKRLFIGFNIRHMESSLAIRRFVSEGRLGRPVLARSWMRVDEPPWWGKHHVSGLSGGGTLAAASVHMVDLLTWLAGSPTPTAVSAWNATLFPGKRGASAPAAAIGEYDVEDVFFGQVRFASGFHLALESTWMWDAEVGFDTGFELLGDRGQGSLEPLRLFEEQEGRPTEVTGEYSARPPTIVDAVPDSMARELGEVVAAIRGEVEETVTATGREGLVVQAVVDALYASARQNAEQPVPGAR